MANRTVDGWRRKGACWLLLGLMAAVPRISSADDRQVMAQELFDTAMKLMDEKDYAGACPKLEDSYKLDPQVGTLFHLAQCHEKIGRLASAWVTYTEVADRARGLGKSTHAAEAQARADALRVRLLKLILVVPEKLAAAPGLSITRNGTEVAASSFGAPVPVDPGKHVIRVSATGKRPWETTVETIGEANTTTVAVPELKDEPELRPVPTAAPTVSATATPSAAATVERGWSTQRTLGVVAAGVGLAGVGIGLGFGGDAAGKLGAAKPLCNDNLTPAVCDRTGLDLREGARTSATISTIAVIAGGIFVAGGVVLFLTAPKPEPSPSTRSARAPRTVWVAPAFGATTGLSVGASW